MPTVVGPKHTLLEIDLTSLVITERPPSKGEERTRAYVDMFTASGFDKRDNDKQKKRDTAPVVVDVQSLVSAIQKAAYDPRITGIKLFNGSGAPHFEIG